MENSVASTKCLVTCVLMVSKLLSLKVAGALNTGPNMIHLLDSRV